MIAPAVQWESCTFEYLSYGWSRIMVEVMRSRRSWEDSFQKRACNGPQTSTLLIRLEALSKELLKSDALELNLLLHVKRAYHTQSSQ
jgi:hypothetical protein